MEYAELIDCNTNPVCNDDNLDFLNIVKTISIAFYGFIRRQLDDAALWKLAWHDVKLY